MEICLLKKEIHLLKKAERRLPEKPTFKTVYEQSKSPGLEPSYRGHRHNRVFSIGEYRPDDFRAKLSPGERSYYGNTTHYRK